MTAPPDSMPTGAPGLPPGKESCALPMAAGGWLEAFRAGQDPGRQWAQDAAEAWLRDQGDLAAALDALLTFDAGLGNAAFRACTHLDVEGDLHLNGRYGGLQGLRDLPDDLRIRGDLHLSFCPLRALPKGLRVRGELVLFECWELRTLAEGLVIEWTGWNSSGLELIGCDRWDGRVPADARIGGSIRAITMEECLTPRLTRSVRFTLEEWWFMERLQAWARPLFMTWKAGADLGPEAPGLLDKLKLDARGFGVSGKGFALLVRALLRMDPVFAHAVFTAWGPIRAYDDVDLRGCPELACLPDDLQIDDGDLDLSGCRSLKTLGRKLTVSGSLRLAGCGKLAALPEDLYVRGDLLLRGCGALKSLPEGLTVGEAWDDSLLDLRECYSWDGTLPETGQRPSRVERPERPAPAASPLRTLARMLSMVRIPDLLPPFLVLAIMAVSAYWLGQAYRSHGRIFQPAVLFLNNLAWSSLYVYRVLTGRYRSVRSRSKPQDGRPGPGTGRPHAPLRSGRSPRG